MKKNWTCVAVIVVSIIAAFSVHSIARAGLLDEHFGVSLGLDSGHHDPYQGTTTYGFDLDSFAPTNHSDTVDYVVGDWYGYWSKTGFQYTTVRGAYPESAEPYDVEALYFDDDSTSLYIAAVTSFPGPAGYHENRIGSSPLVVTGDLAIDLGLNPERSQDHFSYDYGVNINHENRQSHGYATSGGNAVGEGVYRTDNSDWYVGTPRYQSAAGGELTNFDPGYNNFSGSYLGEATVDYYEYQFEGGLLECGAPTYVLEVTISRGLLDSLCEGDQVDISFVEGCRNDGDRHSSILRFDIPPDIDYDAPGGCANPVPEPTTMTLFGLGAALAYVCRKRRTI